MSCSNIMPLKIDREPIFKGLFYDPETKQIYKNRYVGCGGIPIGKVAQGKIKWNKD